MVTINRQIRNFVDLDFAFSKHPVTKNVTLKKDANAIKQSVLNLLLLKEGDKPFHPEIASPVTKYLFENASPVIRFLIQDEVRTYLNTYEERIQVEKVEVTFPNPNQINLVVSAILINTSEPLTITLLVDRLR